MEASRELPASAAPTAVEDSARLYRWLAESATDIVSLRDPDGVYRYVSPSVATLTGHTPADLIGNPAAEYVHPDDLAAVAAAWGRVLSHDVVERVEYRARRRDGSWVWVETDVRALRDGASGQVVQCRTATRDITERRASIEKLRATTAELETRLRQTAAIAQLGELALEEPELDRFLDAAVQSVAEILDVPLCAVLEVDGGAPCGLRLRAATAWGDHAGPPCAGAPGEAAELLGRLARGPLTFDDPSDAPCAQTLGRQGAGSGVWTLVGERERPFAVLAVHARRPRTLASEDTTFLVAVANILRDAIARQRAEEAARHDALHDALTGLPNRALLADRLRQALARSTRTRERLAVLFLDIDHFKLVNDSLGHHVGDSLLCAVAARLSAAVRPSDTVARFGGDEFVVLCDAVEDEDHGSRIACRLVDALTRPFALGDRSHVVSASAGLVVTDGWRHTVEELLRDADTAMYRAKDDRRGGWALFTTSMRERALARLEIEDELRRALANDELVVHYQPIYRVDDGGVAGLEALVRWPHPERGLLLPGTFVPIAEESDLIVSLGTCVLRQACAQFARWRAALPAFSQLALTVNVSARQLARPALVEEVLETLARTGLPGHALVLEITEGALVREAGVAAGTIDTLRAHGIRVALDDFGTGYASLSYLQRFPLDVLKIDRSFMAGLHERIEDRAIVQAIVTMAHALGMDVTAEGVETPEQLQVVRELGSAHVQGFLFSRPLSPEDTVALLGG